MLSAIVPGLREVRSTLVAGYLWLVAGYVGFGAVETTGERVVFSNSMVDPVVNGVRDLGGSLLLGGIITSFAWIAGTISHLVSGILDAVVRKSGENQVVRQVAADRVDAVAPSRSGRASKLLTKLAFTDGTTSQATVLSTVSEEPLAMVARRMQEDGHDSNEENLTVVVRELSGGLCRDRLLTADKDRYEEVSRRQAEAAVRLDILLPGIVSAAVVILRFDLGLLWSVLLFVATVLVLVVLWVDGLWQRREAKNSVAYAVAERMISTERLDRLDRLSETLKGDTASQPSD